MDNIGAAIGQGILDALGSFLASVFPFILLSLAILVIVVLVLREVLTWYWKINKMVALLEQIEVNTRKPEMLQVNARPQKVVPVVEDSSRSPMGN